MADKETKKITVELCVPVTLVLDVSWDPDDEQSEIHSVEVAHTQGVTPRTVYESIGEEDAQHIDDLARKAHEAT